MPAAKRVTKKAPAKKQAAAKKPAAKKAPKPRRTKHEAVLEFALSLPGAWEDHPWGEVVVKVGKKIFVFLGMPETSTGCGVKLRESHEEALGVEGAEPSGYGLGKAGWVNVPFGRSPSVGVICDWVEESYRTVAPKKLVKELDERG
jgi:predicted DNA-binding protein (MmcQ/YjbR family)